MIRFAVFGRTMSPDTHVEPQGILPLNAARTLCLGRLCALSCFFQRREDWERYRKGQRYQHEWIWIPILRPDIVWHIYLGENMRLKLPYEDVDQYFSLVCWRMLIVFLWKMATYMKSEAVKHPDIEMAFMNIANACYAGHCDIKMWHHSVNVSYCIWPWNCVSRAYWKELEACLLNVLCIIRYVTL